MNKSSRFRTLCLAFCLTTLAGTAMGSDGGQLLKLDLATAGGQAEVSWPAGELDVLLLNCLPEGHYSTSWVVERQPIDSLALPKLPVVPAVGGALAGGGACGDLDAAINALADPNKKLQDEKQVEKIVSEIQVARKECADSALAAAAEKAVGATQRLVSLTVPLRQGEQGVLTVTRVSASGASVTWTRKLVAPASGRWLTSYGFNFLSEDNDEYTTTLLEEQPGQFVIRKSSSSGGLELKPAIFFTWIPHGWDRAGASFGITGGLDFDGDSVAVFAGPSAYVGDNLHLTIGVAVRQVRRLRGEYSDGQTLSQPLAPDQLTRKTYSPGFFAGLGFRFDKSPFSKAAAQGADEHPAGSAKGQ